MKVVAALIVIIIGLVVGGTPFVIGGVLEAMFQQEITSIEAETGQSFDVVSYDRGWLNSTATVQTHWAGRPLIWHFQIHHGIWPHFNLGTIETQWHPDSGTLQQLVNGDVLKIKAVIALDGHTTIYFLSPAIQGAYTNEAGQKVRVSWDGAKGSYQVGNVSFWGWFSSSAARDAVRDTLAVSAGHLKIQRGKQEIGFKGLQLKATSKPHHQDEMSLVQKLDSTGQLDIDSLHFQAPAANISFSSDLHLQGAMKTLSNNLLNTDWQIKLHRPQVEMQNNHAFKAHEIQIAVQLEHLDQEALMALHKAVVSEQEKITRTDDENEIAEIRKNIKKLWQSMWPAVLTHSSRLQLTIPTIQTEHGNAKAQATVSFANKSDSTGATHMKNVKEILDNVQLNFNASISNTLAEAAIERAEKPIEIRRLLRAYVARGLISKRAHDVLHIEGLANQHGIIVNGHPWP